MLRQLLGFSIWEPTARFQVPGHLGASSWPTTVDIGMFVTNVVSFFEELGGRVGIVHANHFGRGGGLTVSLLTSFLSVRFPSGLFVIRLDVGKCEPCETLGIPEPYLLSFVLYIKF